MEKKIIAVINLMLLVQRIGQFELIKMNQNVTKWSKQIGFLKR